MRSSAGDPLSISLLPLERAQTLRRQILTSAPASPDAPEEAGFDDGKSSKPAEALDDGEVLATLDFKRQVTALAYRAVALGVPVAVLVGAVGTIVLTIVDLPAGLWGLPTASKTVWVLIPQIFLLVAAGIGNPVARRNH